MQIKVNESAMFKEEKTFQTIGPLKNMKVLNTGSRSLRS
jgi:hypothetical protein